MMAVVPWDVVQKAFGVQGAVILAILVRLALRDDQKAIDSQPLESTAKSRRLGDDPAKKAMEGDSTSIQAHRGPSSKT
jgi:hypothetical protein